MIIEEEKYFVCIGMRRFGGGFVKSLGETLLHADWVNVGKIKETWSEYWEEYLKMGKKLEGVEI